jgi:prepilin-type N-terminal cleavage/methylation domain-containing protein
MMTLGIGKGRLGLSLLEIMVTLVILGALATFAAVQFGGLDQEEEIGRTASEIRKLAQRGLRTALAKGRTTVVRLDASQVVAGRESFALPEGMELEIRPWGATRWVRPEGYQWIFEPSGLCEPIGMRLSLAGSWRELVFHPLTADADDEQAWTQ